MPVTWVPDVSPSSDFSLANLPFGIISRTGFLGPRVAVAIGSQALDLEVLRFFMLDFNKWFPSLNGHENVFSQSTLNAFAALGRPVHRQVRQTLQDILSAETTHPELLRDDARLRSQAFVTPGEFTMHPPMDIGDYTDFYAGYHHAFAVGCMFRGPQNALQPNYTHLPVGYHGRGSSIYPPGTAIYRPTGQILLDPTADPKQPITAPCRRLDFELELGCFIAKPNDRHPVSVTGAEEYIFGYVLLNDWSARDIQTWEYMPLGPFNSKNFATTISPWVVLADALEPFRTIGIENKTMLQDYLKESRADNVFDIQLEVELKAPTDQHSSVETTISRTSSKHLMWSFPQMIAHHTLGGCPLRTGDLLGSGTISGPGPGEQGSLLEMSEGGKKDVQMNGGTCRRFLLDGDTVTIRGFCGKEGEKVGFGDCTGTISPSPALT